MKILLALVLLVTLLLSGCAEPMIGEPTRPSSKPLTPTEKLLTGELFKTDDGRGTVVFFHDEEREVGIWIYKNCGIAVLPDADYK